jgi:hypothetical protein
MTFNIRVFPIGRNGMAYAARVEVAHMRRQTCQEGTWRWVQRFAPRRRSWITAAALALGASLLGGCYGKESERLSCDDVLPAASIEFQSLVTLVNDEDKGCVASGCHSAEAQEKGIRLDTTKLVYEEFSQRPDLFYAMVASGEMPEEGTRWSDDDLLQFRSWYCAGAFPP